MTAEFPDYQDMVNQGLQNVAVAVIQEGIELDFQGERCGRSYRVKHTCIKTWDSFFYDWREGWVQLRQYGGWHNHAEAVAACNQHAAEKGLLKFLPHRPRYRLNPAIMAGPGIAAVPALNCAMSFL